MADDVPPDEDCEDPSRIAPDDRSMRSRSPHSSCLSIDAMCHARWPSEDDFACGFQSSFVARHPLENARGGSRSSCILPVAVFADNALVGDDPPFRRLLLTAPADS